MNTTTLVNAAGIDFECEWHCDEDYDGEKYIVLDSVAVNGVDIIEIILPDWLRILEDTLIDELEKEKKQAEFEAELDNHEFYGI